MKWYYDLHKNDVPFKVGDKVLLKGRDLRVKVSSEKLMAKNYGPYTIMEKVGPVSFRLNLPKQMRVHPVFHASKFIPYHEDEIGDRNPPQPPPIEVEGYEEFEVEKILDSRVYRGWVQYLVKWDGYDESHASWEPVRNVRDNAREAIKEFHDLHPDAPEPESLQNPRPMNKIFNCNIRWNLAELESEEGVV